MRDLDTEPGLACLGEPPLYVLRQSNGGNHDQRSSRFALPTPGGESPQELPFQGDRVEMRQDDQTDLLAEWLVRRADGKSVPIERTGQCPSCDITLSVVRFV
jgi:hypothetical protein